MGTIVNVSSIGNVFLVLDEYGNKHNIQVLKYTDLLISTIGEFSDEYYSSYSEYMSLASDMMSGFIKSEYDVCWHRTSINDFEMVDVIGKCVDQGACMAIVEFIDQEPLALN